MQKELVVKMINEYIESTKKLNNLLSSMLDETDNTKKLNDDELKRAAYSLNMCTVSVSQIIDYKDTNILEQEYEAILNNINLEQIPKDEALLHILKQLLDTITYFRIEEGEKQIIEKEYQQKMKNAIWSAVPNFGLIVAGGSPLTMAISLASQVGIGYMNYRRNREEYNLDKERQTWRLQRSAIEQFNGLRRELFDTAWRLADTYNFPDKYRLTERQISQYNEILMDTDELRKFERLDYIKDKFEAYPPFWYFFGNAANYIAGNANLKLQVDTREYYRNKAKEYFEKYEELETFNILREDKLVATCALEHIDLLLDEENGLKTNEQKIKDLLKLAIKSAGNSFDIIELCALAYLKIGNRADAAKILKMLVNEDYNSIINAQILSSIYVYEGRSAIEANKLDKYKQIVANYELLSLRIDKNYLFPMPQKGEGLKELESNFGVKQKEILKSMFEITLENLVQKYSIEWNKITSTFELGKDYPDKYFVNTSAAKNYRKKDFKKLCTDSEKFDYYKERLANADYSFNLLNILNEIYDVIIQLEYFNDDPALLNEIEIRIKKAINEYNEVISQLQKSITDKKFNLKDYQLSQDITIEVFVNGSLQRLLKHVNNKIDVIKDLNEITSIESALRAFCLKNKIDEPLLAFEVDEEEIHVDRVEKFLPDLLGHKTVVAKRNADFVKSLTAFVRERMAGIVSESKKGEIFYNGESVFNSYFDNERFNAFASLKKHSIMIITGCNNEDVDLIFTTDRIVTVINQEVKYGIRYHDVERKKNAILLYNGYIKKLKIEDASINTGKLYNLIQEISKKTITNLEEKTEYIENIDPVKLNRWFKDRKDAFGENVVRAYVLPTKSVFKSLGYLCEEDLDTSNSILQLYFDNVTNAILGLRLVQYKNINSQFQAKLMENNGILKLK